MVFAAGLGTRMGALTESTPKPLVHVAGAQLLDYALTPFERAGCTRIVVNAHYLGDQIADYLAQRQSPSELCLSHEIERLETGGGIVQALSLLGDAPFFSANSDAFILDAPGSSALARLAQAFDPDRWDGMLLLHPVERAVGYAGHGNFDLSPEGELVRSERPAFVFTGIQILHPRLFRGRPATPFSLRALYDEAEQPSGVLRRFGGVVHEGDWVHVGTPLELTAAEAFLRSRSEPQTRSP